MGKKVRGTVCTERDETGAFVMDPKEVLKFYTRVGDNPEKWCLSRAFELASACNWALSELSEESHKALCPRKEDESGS